MAVIGARAHRLDLRRGRIVAAEREGENLLDQTGAGAARRRCLGVGTHVVDREQFLFADRLDDRALADAVASADFRVVAHGSDRILAAMAAVAEIGGAVPADRHAFRLFENPGQANLKAIWPKGGLLDEATTTSSGVRYGAAGRL